VIRSFRDKHTRRVLERRPGRRFPRSILRAALRKLVILDAAEALEDLRVPPGNRLEKLAGDRRGRYSIRVNERWRICFRWSRGDARDVEIVDYHRG
jgi:proteic killer suppression protein